ncbi:MAG: AbrB family transcriptional regulator [Pseudomonadota bacterium]
MTPQRLASLVAHLFLGFLGGLVADRAGLPMPFLLGALMAVAPLIIWQGARGVPTLQFPRGMRFAFVGIIGTLIGMSFTPDLLAKLPSLWISLLLVVVFVVAAHALGYTVYRRVGGYDRVTALYGSMPGGLIEGVSLGEQAGGNPMLLTVHHFARIVIVVFSVPLLFVLVAGETVGSAAGFSVGAGGAGPLDTAGIVALTAAGLVLGKICRLPAWHLTGGLLLAAVVHGAGWMSLTGPGWLVDLAQLVVGTALATQFSGASPRVLSRAFGLTLVAVSAMFVAAALLALLVTGLTPLSYPAAFISFAPGGVAEMGLIALSLDASPVIVAAHHLLRIVITVVLVRVADAQMR